MQNVVSTSAQHLGPESLILKLIITLTALTKPLSFSAFLQFTHPIDGIKAADMRGTLENFQSVLLTGSLILKASKTRLCDSLSLSFCASFPAGIFKAAFSTSLPICFLES